VLLASTHAGVSGTRGYWTCCSPCAAHRRPRTSTGQRSPTGRRRGSARHLSRPREEDHRCRRYRSCSRPLRRLRRFRRCASAAAPAPSTSSSDITGLLAVLDPPTIHGGAVTPRVRARSPVTCVVGTAASS